MKRKHSPQFVCPICGKLLFNKEEATYCANLDVKEQAKARELTDVDKLTDKELKNLTKSNNFA